MMFVSNGPRLVGREQEQQALAAALSAAQGATGGLVLVTGEAGIGKTSLVTATLSLARAAGALVGTGTCWDGDGAPGYWPWTQVIRALRLECSEDAWERAAAEAGAGLGRLLGARGPVGGGSSLFDVVDAVTAVLQLLSRDRPVVVALDDLHWADRPSVGLLNALVSQARLGRILLVGAYRDDEVAIGDHPLHTELGELAAKATSVSLSGLDVDGCAVLLDRHLRSSVATTAADVQRRTGGNPFFVQQLLQLWESSGVSGSMPVGVGSAIERRVARLPTATAEALGAASLLGQRFETALLAAVLETDVEEIRERLDAARVSGLVAVDGIGGWRFVHDLVREVLHASITANERRRRHAAAARALQVAPHATGTVTATQRAYHAVLAIPEIPPSEVVDILLGAAADASSRLAAGEAVGHLQRALGLLGADDARRVAITVQLATEQRRAGALIDSRSTYSRLLGEAAASGDAAAYAEAAIGLHALGALIHVDEDRLAPLLEARDRLLGDCGQPSTVRDALLARVLGCVVRTHAHQTELDRSGLDELSSEAVELARRSGDASALSFALLARHDAIWSPDTADARLELTMEMAVAARRGVDPEMEVQAVLLEFVARLELGQPAALGAIEHYFGLEARLQLPRCRFVAISRRATVATFQGRFAEAEQYVNEAFAMGERLGEVDRQGVFCDQLWELARLRGAADAMDDILATWRGDPHILVLETAVALDKGDVAAVERLRDRFVQLGVAWPRWARTVWWTLEAELAVAAGSLERCRQVRAMLEPLAGRWAVLGGGVIVRGPVDHWLAVIDTSLGDFDAAISEFESARVSSELIGARPWVVQARAGLAGALIARGRSGDAPDAAAAVAAATSEARILGMQRVLTEMASLESRTSARRGRFVCQEDVWTLALGDATIQLPDSKGLRDLHLLVQHPGVDIAAVELLNPRGGDAIVASRRLGADAVLDDRARAEYRKRLATLEEAIANALDRGDDRRAQHLDIERDSLLAELQAATGLGGRQRRLGDEGEKARKAVTARIRDALRRIGQRDAALADHLNESIVTGARCKYDPVTPVVWDT